MNIRTVLDIWRHATFRKTSFHFKLLPFVHESFHVTVTSSLLHICFLNLLKLFSVKIRTFLQIGFLYFVLNILVAQQSSIFFYHSYQFVIVNRDKASEDLGHWPQSLGPPIPLWHIWLGSPCIKWRWQQTPYTRVMWLCVLNRKVVFNSVCQVEAYSSTKRLCPKLAQELGRYKLVLQQNYT